MEIWKDIPGYEGRYQVSDLGNVRSVDRYMRAVSKAGREYPRLARGKTYTSITQAARGERVRAKTAAGWTV